MNGRPLFKKEDVHVTLSEKETFLLAKHLASEFCGQEVLLLVGELGAGKTVFAKGIAAGLGIQDIHQVCSPSFTILNIYQARCPIFHIDLYRLEEETEILDLGWEDWIGAGVIIVEWGEKVSFPLPHAIYVHIQTGNTDERIIKISTQKNLLT